MAQRIKTIQRNIPIQKIVELVIGTLVASVVTVHVLGDEIGTVLGALPEILK